MYPELKLFFLNLKKLFRGKDGELSLVGRLAAGACAGMTSTFVSNAFVLWHFWFMSVFLLSLKWFFWVVFLGTLEPSYFTYEVYFMDGFFYIFALLSFI